MIVNDYLLDADGDLAEQDNEWLEGEAVEDEVVALCYINKAELTEFPVSGFGIRRFMKQRWDENKFLRELEIELDNDGLGAATIDISGGIENFKIII